MSYPTFNFKETKIWNMELTNRVRDILINEFERSRLARKNCLLFETAPSELDYVFQLLCKDLRSVYMYDTCTVMVIFIH